MQNAEKSSAIMSVICRDTKCLICSQGVLHKPLCAKEPVRKCPPTHGHLPATS